MFFASRLLAYQFCDLVRLVTFLRVFQVPCFSFSLIVLLSFVRSLFYVFLLFVSFL